MWHVYRLIIWQHFFETKIQMPFFRNDAGSSSARARHKTCALNAAKSTLIRRDSGVARRQERCMSRDMVNTQVAGYLWLGELCNELVIRVKPVAYIHFWFPELSLRGISKKSIHRVGARVWNIKKNTHSGRSTAFGGASGRLWPRGPSRCWASRVCVADRLPLCSLDLRVRAQRENKCKLAWERVPTAVFLRRPNLLCGIKGFLALPFEISTHTIICCVFY